MKTIKSITLLAGLIVLIGTNQLYSDGKTQDKIRKIVEKHALESKELQKKKAAKIVSDKQAEKELEKILESFKHDMSHALKHAPETTQYKELKKAVNLLNSKQIATNTTHISSILKNVDKDIKQMVLDLIPAEYRFLFMFF